MNSKERKEIRYWKRAIKRVHNRIKIATECGYFDDVYSYSNLIMYGLKCCKNVGWKYSTQSYRVNLINNVNKLYNKIHSGNYTGDGFNEFDIIERGKPRHIMSVTISERTAQKVSCDKVLVPTISNCLIYDNGASLEGKGISFAHKRLNRHLRKYYRENGNDGYVLTYDFSKFFDTAPHDYVKSELNRRIIDSSVRDMIYTFIDAFGDRGYGLGSQVSQISAILVPNKIDHCIKEKLNIKYYARYMDDGYLIHKSKQYLKECLDIIVSKCKSMGLVINPKKTKILKLKEGFSFLKKRIRLTDKGKIIKKIEYKSVRSMKRKLKKFYYWNMYGKVLYSKKHKKKSKVKFSLFDIYTSYQSWRECAGISNNYWMIYKMDNYFYNLFYFHPLNKEKLMLIKESKSYV